MRYLCLVHFDETLLGTLAATALAALERESRAYEEELRTRGQLVVAHALQPVKTAKVVQLRQDRITWRDGPLAQTKEQLGGFLLVDVPDLNAAVQIAARLPIARHASVEVRRVAVVERMAT